MMESWGYKFMNSAGGVIDEGEVTAPNIQEAVQEVNVILRNSEHLHAVAWVGVRAEGVG